MGNSIEHNSKEEKPRIRYRKSLGLYEIFEFVSSVQDKITKRSNTKNQLQLYGKYYEEVMKELNLKNENLQPTYERFLKTVPLNPSIFEVSHYLSDSFKKYMETFEYKILLLGCGDSGKSTLYQQFHYYKEYDFNFREEELLSYKNTVYANILMFLSQIIKICIKKNLFKNYNSNEYAQKILFITENDNINLLMKSSQYYTEEIHKSVIEILKDSAIQDIMNGDISVLHLPDGLYQFVLSY